MDDSQYNNDDSLDLDDVLGEEYFDDFDDNDDDFVLPEEEDDDDIDPVAQALNQFGLSDEEESMLSDD